MVLSVTSIAANHTRLNRSIYVPIKFSLCEHLSRGILFVNEQPVGQLPIQQIFQFTYYAELERMAPEVILIRIEGVGKDGEPFIGRLVVK